MYQAIGLPGIYKIACEQNDPPWLKRRDTGLQAPRNLCAFKSHDQELADGGLKVVSRRHVVRFYHGEARPRMQIVSEAIPQLLLEFTEQVQSLKGRQAIGIYCPELLHDFLGEWGEYREL